MPHKLKNKKILFIGPIFFDHHKVIIKELQNFGAFVFFYSEKPNYFFSKIIKSLSLSLYKLLNKIHLDNIKKKSLKHEFDYIFVIRGEILTTDFMLTLRQNNPNAIFIMYQWDSVKNNNYLSLISAFDFVYSFDREDCSNYNIRYFPLYYRNEYKEIRSLCSGEYDFLYIGSYLKERQSFLQSLETYLQLYNKKFYFYEYIKPLKYIKYKIIEKNKIKYASIFKLNSSKVLELYKKSKCIIDMPSDHQTGLTMRTFECLGSFRKLVTTNTNIQKEKLFHQNNIQIINNCDINIDLEILNNKFINLEEIDNYSITEWIKKIFNDIN